MSTITMARPSSNPISKSSVAVHPKKSLCVLMTQSTIYRQHEVRLARSNRLKDDPRPPLVRVLSLLPGLHLFVPRYEPPSTTTTTSTCQSSFDTASTSIPISLSLGSMYSEETKFIKDDDKSALSSTMTMTSSTPHQQQSHSSMLFPAVLSTAIAAAMGHAMFGKRQSFVLSTNPFQSLSLSYSVVRSSLPTTITTTTTTTLTQPLLPVVVMAASTATLFGTRVYLEELETSEANHFFTGAMAGMSSGVVAVLLSSIGVGGGCIGSMTTRLLSSPHYMGSHVVGGMAYFGIYEYLKNTMQSGDDSTNNNNNSTTPLPTSALAGAVAGSLQAALVTRLPMACLRAAPMHAMIWCAYESATTTTTTTAAATTTTKHNQSMSQPSLV